MIRVVTIKEKHFFFFFFQGQEKVREFNFVLKQGLQKRLLVSKGNFIAKKYLSVDFCGCFASFIDK